MKFAGKILTTIVLAAVVTSGASAQSAPKTAKERKEAAKAIREGRATPPPADGAAAPAGTTAVKPQRTPEQAASAIEDGPNSKKPAPQTASAGGNQTGWMPLRTVSPPWNAGYQKTRVHPVEAASEPAFTSKKNRTVVKIGLYEY
jgi:hypothetical protein